MHKKLSCFFFILLLANSAWAQIQKDFLINWEPIISQENSKEAHPTRWESSALMDQKPEATLKPSAFHRLDLENIQITETWKDQNMANPSSIKLSNLRYEPLSEEELHKLNKDAVSKELTYKINSSRARDLIYTSLSYNPVVFQNGNYLKLVSFRLSYDYQVSRTELAYDTYNTETNSIFATGNWYKFEVDQSGVYKIDGNFLSKMGIDLKNIQPERIKIHGHGGDALALSNATNEPIDPPQVSIGVYTKNPNEFSKSDYILFYAKGTRTYNNENDSHINPYSDHSYYYITIDGAPGLRINTLQEPTANASKIITSYKSIGFHEVDAYSPAKVGRRWFGNRFDVQNLQSFSFSFPDIIFGSEYKVTVKTAAASSSTTSMLIDFNNQSSKLLSYPPISDPVFLITRDTEAQLTANSSDIQITANYNNNANPSSNAYIDYIRIEALSHLKGRNQQFIIKSDQGENPFSIGEFRMSNAQNISEIWDITDLQNVQSKANNGQEQLHWKANLAEERTYLAVNKEDYYQAIAINRPKLQNQNLKGRIFRDAQGNFKDIDYLIISPPHLIHPATRLADHHKLQNNLNVKVVSTQEIYEEFSSGKQDISAIRNFVRYVYNNSSSIASRVKYLALFGDTSVDYKNRWEANNNYLPTFHTLESTSNYSSYMSDDFFGMMDINEGSMHASDKLDIAVGRILADSPSLANAMVDKVIAYQKEPAYGSWRNNILTISDDVDKAYEFESIQNTLNNLSDDISLKKPSFNVKKILADAYVQQTSAGGNRYPDVNKAITESIEVGSLVVNYFGHGGEDGLAHEFIYTQNDAKNLNNTNKYPLFITVTCEFTKFDYPQRITAGELTYWNRKGGAISLVTTTRAISVSLGIEVNMLLTPELLGYQTNTQQTPAEALRITKNKIGDPLKRVVFYIGDPAMHLAQPKAGIELLQINDKPISAENNTTIEALGKIKLSGILTDESGNLLSNYNGTVDTKVFDKRITRKTIGNDGVRNDAGELLRLDFTTLGEVIFNGQASVSNGVFDIEFVAPRDIRPELGFGKISFYSKRTGVLEDRTGQSQRIQVGGINKNAVDDHKGPEIQVYLNDESFVSGGTTNSSPLLLVKFEDENGINTSSGIGHDILAYLDGDETNPIKLNEYYQAELDDYTKGSLQYQFKDLEKGMHSLKLKAWDVYNNSSTVTIDFFVAEKDKLEITKVLNYPNPFVSYTEFWFHHNRPYEPLEVQVQVLTVSGKIVWSKNQIITTDGLQSREITWDGRDDFGDRIGKGVYIYKISVKSTLTNQRAEKFEKLVVL